MLGLGEDSLIGTVLNDTYRIERLIGAGGMGTVFEVSHLRLGRHFALKLITPDRATDPQALARFQREAQVTSKLGHPHIIDVVDFNQTPEGASYIVMELLEGEDLASRLKRSPRLEIQEVAGILHQAASALHAAHGKGIIHRDLKPQNIFLCQIEGQSGLQVKVLDFGISKVLGSQTGMTRSQAVMGTPGYMAPEQAEARNTEIGPRTDVFAMGVLVYEMLAGEQPFKGETPVVVLYQIVFKEPPPLRSLCPEISEDLERVIAKAMHKSPDERHESMAAFSQELLAAAGVGDTSPIKLVVAPDPASAASTAPAADVEEHPETGDDGGSISQETRRPTTLRGATGELASFVERTRRRRSTGQWLAVGVVGIALAASIAVLLWKSNGTRPDSPPLATGRAPDLQSTASGPMDAMEVPPTIHRIKVTADDPGVACRARIDHGELQSQSVPCAFDVTDGQQIDLQLVRRGFKPFSQAWKVDAARDLAVEVSRRQRRVLLLDRARSGTDTETRGVATRSRKRSRPKVEPKAAAPETRAPTPVRPDARAPKSTATSPSPGPPATVTKSAKEPPKAPAKAPGTKAKPKPKRFDEGTVAF
jgi:serine/threonine protein kinase